MRAFRRAAVAGAACLTLLSPAAAQDLPPAFYLTSQASRRAIEHAGEAILGNMRSYRAKIETFAYKFRQLGDVGTLEESDRKYVERVTSYLAGKPVLRCLDGFYYMKSAAATANDAYAEWELQPTGYSEFKARLLYIVAEELGKATRDCFREEEAILDKALDWLNKLVGATSEDFET